MNRYVDFFKKYLPLYLILVVVLVSLFQFKLRNDSDDLNDRYSDEVEKREEDVFDKLDEMTEEDVDEFGQLSANGKNARYIKMKDTYCPAFENVFIAYEGIMVANVDGQYATYEYTLDKKYSDETNCKLKYKMKKNPIQITDAIATYKDSRLLMATYVVYEDKSYSIINDPNNYEFKTIYEVIDGIETSKPLKHVIVEWKNSLDYYIACQGVSSSINDSCLTIRKQKVSRSSTGDVLLELADDEEVLTYYDGVIVTNKAIYTKGIVDYSCRDYIDKECKEGYVENTDFTNRYDDIMFLNSRFVVFKDGSTYQYSLHYWD